MIARDVRRTALWLLIAAVWFSRATGAVASAPIDTIGAASQDTYWQQDVHYTIDVRVDDRGHNLNGSETLDYTNNSPDTLSVLWLHLYPNAFRSARSTFMRDRLATDTWVLAGVPRKYRHWMDVSDVAVDGVAVDTYLDDTLLRLALPRSLTPGAHARVTLGFSVHIGPVIARAGARGRHIDAAQWYPKVVVYDEKGWHLDQYRGRGEFYGEFGTYDVTLHVPRDQVVAATGVLVDGDAGWDAARRRVTSNPRLIMQDTLIVRAAPVDAPASAPAGVATESPGVGAEADTAHAGLPARPDSATSAVQVDSSGVTISPASDSTTAEEHTHSTARPDSLKTVTFHAEQVHDFAWVCDPTFAMQDTTLGPTHVMTFFRAWNTSWKDSSLAHAVRALRWLARLVGPYPYPSVTMTDALRGGGMEYPMLVMNGRADEALAVHEIGHIYFYGLLANNEMDEAWMDEGMTTWQATHYMMNRYGPRALPPSRDPYRRILPSLGVWDRNAVELTDLYRQGYWEPLSQPAWAFKNNYNAMVYGKGARTMEALRYTLGDSVFSRVLHEYYRTWRFRHVNEERFRAVCERVSGRNLGWFFREWLHSTDAVEYGWTRVRGHLTPVPHGRAEMPLRIVRYRADGRSEVIHLIGPPDTLRTAWLQSVPTSDAEGPATRVVINPANEILDVNMMNNTWPHVPLEVRWDYPFWNYRPPRTYLVATRPGITYDAAGGVTPGWRLRTSYLGDTWATETSAWYATRSRHLFARMLFSTPTPALGPRSAVRVELADLAGRTRVGVDLARTIRRFLLYPPDWRWSVGASAWNVYDTTYTVGWSRGQVQSAQVGAGVAPRADVAALDAQVTVTVGRFDPAPPGREDAHVYHRALVAALARSDPQWNLPVSLALRLAVGHASARAPSQELFRLAGTPPLLAWNDPLARSRGTLPDEVPYHIAGDANVRGYIERNPLLTWFAVGNLSVGWVRSPQPPVLRRAAAFSLYAFTDVGRAGLARARARAVADLGVGAILTRSVGMGSVRLRVDIPFAVAHPELADTARAHAIDARWVVGFGEAF
jgi:hypothetical protein